MNHDPSLSDARKFLRDSTHADHVRLNHHPLLVGLTKPAYPIVMYPQVLLAQYHFYLALEAAIDQFYVGRQLDFSYDNRRKLPLLRDDLRHFGIDPDALAWRPHASHFPIRLDDIGQLLGVLYTIEGSSLGGQIVFRHLSAHAGLTASQGARFFHGYGERTMACWLQFEDFMGANLTQAETRTSALQSAKAAFALMHAILDEYMAWPVGS